MSSKNGLVASTKGPKAALRRKPCRCPSAESHSMRRSAVPVSRRCERPPSSGSAASRREARRPACTPRRTRRRGRGRSCSGCTRGSRSLRRPWHRGADAEAPGSMAPAHRARDRNRALARLPPNPPSLTEPSRNPGAWWREPITQPYGRISRDCYPPAIAPTTRNGSAPEATSSGSGSVAESSERSRPQAKKRMKSRLFAVP
jgi:hypothetical protein